MAGLGKMLKQMNKMQKKMSAVQEELGNQELEVASGGGAVNVTVTLSSEVKKLKLDPDFLKEDPELVEETILEALRDALRQANEKSEAAMQEVTDEFQMPGMPGMS